MNEDQQKAEIKWKAEQELRDIRRRQHVAKVAADKKKFRRNAVAVVVLIVVGFLFGGPLIGLIFAMIGGAVLTGGAISGGFGGGPLR